MKKTINTTLSLIIYPVVMVYMLYGFMQVIGLYI